MNLYVHNSRQLCTHYITRQDKFVLTALQDKRTMYALHFKTGKLCTHIITRQDEFVLTALQDKTPLYSHYYKASQFCTHCITRQDNFVLTLLQGKSSLYSLHNTRQVKFVLTVLQGKTTFYSHYQDKSTLYSYCYKTRKLCTHIIRKQVKFVLTALSNWHIAMFPSYGWVSCVTP